MVNHLLIHSLPIGAKAGLTYKIDGRNIYMEVQALQRPLLHSIIHSFLQEPEIMLSNDPKTEMAKSAEVGYLLHAPRFTGRLSGFVTDMTGTTNIKRFYK